MVSGRVLFLLVGWCPGLRVTAHSSLVSPISRNAVDRVLPPWKGGRFGNNHSCAHPTTYPSNSSTFHRFGRCWGCNCVNGTKPCDVAQTCLYFSQGCTIGCKSCDGGESNPNYRDRCGSGMKPTNNDPYYRTVNQNAAAMTPADLYQHNPWRAPGNAPVFDPCGIAGGSPSWHDSGLSFVDTEFAKQGDPGSGLPYAPTGVVWRQGEEVEAKWSLRADHGGGYQYRLCPVDASDPSKMTEACFQQLPIPFAAAGPATGTAQHPHDRTHAHGKASLEFGNGTRIPLPLRFLSTGTTPEGSVWAMNPLPFGSSSTPMQFNPPCGDPDSSRFDDSGDCSGRFPVGASIVDTLAIPRNITPGEYVLGFRYDCEMTAQVWSSCADITIAAAA